MGEILGLGLSHYPGPVAPHEFWSKMLERSVEVGRVEPDLYADKSRWPAAMREEWAMDEGRAAAERHRDRLLAGYNELAQKLHAFEPDVVLIWGDDQFENFKKDCIPAFNVGIFDAVATKPFRGSQPVFKTGENVWGLPPDTEMPIRGHRKAASDLTRYLIENEFDLSYSLETRHAAGLAHSFNNTILYLDHARHGAGWTYPVIPFHINCYGSDLIKSSASMVGEGEDIISPPSPTPKRCFEIGAATARFFRDSPWRVALIGSASWSHGSLTKKHGRLYPDIDADDRRRDELEDGRFKTWGALTTGEMHDAGQHELLNWIALAGAMTELDQRADILDYVQTYLFNSSKCFAVFSPAK